MTKDHDHDHSDEMQYINLILDDGQEVEYGVLGVFELEDRDYIALVNEEELVYLYGYEEIDEEEIDLINIEDEEEFKLASQEFMRIFGEEEEE